MAGKRLSRLCDYGMQTLKQLLQTVLHNWRERVLPIWRVVGIKHGVVCCKLVVVLWMELGVRHTVLKV